MHCMDERLIPYCKTIQLGEADLVLMHAVIQVVFGPMELQLQVLLL